MFGLGFVLGTVRTLAIEPHLRATEAVLAEVPVMLGASWLAARRIVARLSIDTARAALAMGAFAFVLLLAAEAALAVALGGNLHDWATGLTAMPGAIGFAAQICFGLMPLLVRRPPPRDG